MNLPFPRLTRVALALALPAVLSQCSLLTRAGARLRAVSFSREAPAEPARPQAGLLSGLRSETVADRPSPSTARPATRTTSRGMASFYRVRTNGTRTASGIPLRDSVSTAAHRSLPFGTMVRVTNLRNGRSDVVKITDRGPFIRGRIIDVSYGSAQRLGMVQSGVAPVVIEVLPRPGAI